MRWEIGKWVIGESICEACEGIYHETIYKELEAQHPEWRDEEGSIKREWQKEWGRARNGCPKKICFIFEADCHGDGISLCKEHLLEIVGQIEKAENEVSNA